MGAWRSRAVHPVCLLGFAFAVACGGGHEPSDAAPAEGGTGGDGSGDGPHGSGANVSGRIGTEGGTLELHGSTLSIPAGALDEAVNVTLTEATQTPPDGYDAYSPVYLLEPSGIMLSKPATFTIAETGDSGVAAAFLSRTGMAGYERLGGVPSADSITVAVPRFGSIFVADGVSYADPPDRSCTRTKLYGNSINATSPYGGAIPTSSLSLLFTADDCQGRPITGLTEEDFTLEENGTALSVEAEAAILPRKGLAVFVNLLLDVSGSTGSLRPQIAEGAAAFVQQIQEHPELDVHVAVRLFDGSGVFAVPQDFTLDTASVLSSLNTIATIDAHDPSSTDLYGAVFTGINGVASAEDAFTKRNDGGAVTSGYAVLFTDGRDTAGRRTLADTSRFLRTKKTGDSTRDEALAPLISSPTDQLLAVALKSSPDYTPEADAALRQLTQDGDGLILSDDPATLSRDFRALAERIAGQTKRLYLLGYCSPKRTGTTTVSVKVTGSRSQETATLNFDAGAVHEPHDVDGDTIQGPLCSAATLLQQCDGLQCGGFGCGSCDDREAGCTKGLCVSYCDTQKNLCGGEPLPNPLGYQQSCPDRIAATYCQSACIDTSSDNANCGGCGVVCNGACTSGKCDMLPPEIGMVGLSGTLTTGVPATFSFTYSDDVAVTRCQVDAIDDTGPVLGLTGGLSATLGDVALNNAPSGTATVTWSGKFSGPTVNGVGHIRATCADASRKSGSGPVTDVMVSGVPSVGPVTSVRNIDGTLSTIGSTYADDDGVVECILFVQTPTGIIGGAGSPALIDRQTAGTFLFNAQATLAPEWAYATNVFRVRFGCYDVNLNQGGDAWTDIEIVAAAGTF